MTDDAGWPAIPFEPWKDTCAALHLYTQIVGKYRLAHTPWVNHSWHATLYVNADGLTTGLVPDGPGITVQFDLQRQRLVASGSTGERDGFPLEPMSVATFDSRFKKVIATLGGSPEYHGFPNELPEATPFAENTAARPWDADAVSRFHRALVRIDAVFNEFRTGFLGKVSPVHLFWGSFDLAVTRFSGRPAPLHPGGIPTCPTPSHGKPIVTRSVQQASGPAAAGSMNPAFIPTLIPRPTGSPSSR